MRCVQPRRLDRFFRVPLSKSVGAKRFLVCRSCLVVSETDLGKDLDLR